MQGINPALRASHLVRPGALTLRGPSRGPAAWQPTTSGRAGSREAGCGLEVIWSTDLDPEAREETGLGKGARVLSAEGCVHGPVGRDEPGGDVGLAPAGRACGAALPWGLILRCGCPVTCLL